jgi:HD-like signal output (HDOD) protein
VPRSRRLGQRLSFDAWAAHSAGLFEECGKAVLYRHAPDHYSAMLRAARSDPELVTLEHAGFGVSHDALGAALCESWGLGPAAVASVRHHVGALATLSFPDHLTRRSISALSVIANTLLDAPETLEDVVTRVAPPAELDVMLALRGARQVEEQLAEAESHGH